MTDPGRIQAPVAGWLLAGWTATGWCLVAAVVYLSLAPAPAAVVAPGGDKLGHFAAYATLMFWFAQVVERGRRPMLAGRLLALGLALELAQALSGDREPSVADLGADAAGILAAWWAVRLWLGDLLSRLAARRGA